jgi:hypothetical protein
MAIISCNKIEEALDVPGGWVWDVEPYDTSGLSKEDGEPNFKPGGRWEWRLSPNDVIRQVYERNMPFFNGIAKLKESA